MTGLYAESYLSYLFFKRPYDIIIAGENNLFSFVRRWTVYFRVRCFSGNVPTPDNFNEINNRLKRSFRANVGKSRRKIEMRGENRDANFHLPTHCKDCKVHTLRLYNDVERL